MKNIECQKRLTLVVTILLMLILSGCEGKDTFYTGATNYEYDDQTFFGNAHNIVKTKEGYYFYSMHNNLIFFDKNSSKAVPVCSRINCSHDDDSCDSYFDHLSGGSIWYYDNQLYVMQYDIDDYNYYLSSISLDGSSRKRICDLLKLEVSEEEKVEGYAFGTDIRSLVIHRGYAYFIIPNNSDNQPELRKIRLEKNAKPEVVYTGDDDTSEITRIKGFEDHIYFQAYKYSVSDSKEAEILSANLYDYNIESEDLSVCIKDSIWDYIPMSDKIYFLNQDGLNLYSFKSSQPKLVLEGDSPYGLSYDKEYYYLDNVYDAMINKQKRSISIFDETFQLVDQIDLADTYSVCLFGDKDYLFYLNSSNEGSWIEALDKSQIGTGTYEWIRLD